MSLHATKYPQKFNKWIKNLKQNYNTGIFYAGMAKSSQKTLVFDDDDVTDNPEDLTNSKSKRKTRIL